MKKVLLILLLAFSQLHAQEIPKPVSGSYVHDFANVMTEDQRKALHNKLIQIKQKYTVEIAVITMKTLGDYAIEDYTLKMGREWGVGGKSNNGLVILTAIDDRKWRIEVGPALQGVITDAGSSEMAMEKLVPRFKEGNYFQGFSDLVDAIDVEVNPETAEIRKKEEEKRKIENEKFVEGVINFFLWILGIGIVIGILVYIWNERKKYLEKLERELKDAKSELRAKTWWIKDLFDLRTKIEDQEPGDRIKREVNSICEKYTDLYRDSNRVLEGSTKIEEVKEVSALHSELRDLRKDTNKLSDILKDLRTYNSLKHVNIQYDYYKDIIKEAENINQSFVSEKLEEFDPEFPNKFKDYFDNHQKNLKTKLIDIDTRLKEALDNREGSKADYIYREYKDLKSKSDDLNGRLRASYQYANENKTYLKNFDKIVSGQLDTFVALAGLAYILDSTKEETLAKVKGIKEDAKSLERSPETIDNLRKFVDSIGSNFKKITKEKEKHEEKLRIEREAKEAALRKEREEKERKERERRRKQEEEEDAFIRIMRRSDLSRFYFYENMTGKVRDEYLNRLAVVSEDTDFDWLYESMSFCYSISGMCIELRQSQYGSQHRNWEGWKRIENAINPTLQAKLDKDKEDWDFEEDDEDEDDGEVAIPGYNH